MKKTHPLATYMNPFFNQYLAVQKGLSFNTILAYRDAIKLLLCFAADHLKKTVDKLNIEDFDYRLILDFLNYIENERRCSATTRNARLAAIRTFFNLIGREEPSLLMQSQKIRSIPQKRTKHKTIDYLDEDEIQALLNSVATNSRTAIRDKALLLILYNTGARVQEIVDLKIADLRLDSSGQVKLLGKGKKQRACPLWPETIDAINEYLENRNPKDPDEDHLFLNANDKPITRFGIRYITKQYAKSAGTKCPSINNKVVTPHTLRHSTAMHLIRAGNDINTVSYWLGHADINTTHIYVEIDMDIKRKMLQISPAPKTSKVSKIPKWQEPDILKWLDDLSRKTELCAAN
jgi:integrase/recombinase XerD